MFLVLFSLFVLNVSLETTGKYQIVFNDANGKIALQHAAETRVGSRTTATSKIDHFVITVNG